jgi:hypothetical protein
MFTLCESACGAHLLLQAGTARWMAFINSTSMLHPSPLQHDQDLLNLECFLTYYGTDGDSHLALRRAEASAAEIAAKDSDDRGCARAHACCGRL